MDKLDFEIKKKYRAAVRTERIPKNESRRIAVSEKRVQLEGRLFSVDVKERKDIIAEKKKFLSALSVLVKNLQ